MSTTTINFKMVDLDGTVIPLTKFAITSGRPNVGAIPPTIPARVEFTTDSEGLATVALEASLTVPYYIQKVDYATDSVINYKFFVPPSNIPLSSELLYVDLGKHFKPYNDKSLAALIEAKVVAVNAANKALSVVSILGNLDAFRDNLDNIVSVAENLDDVVVVANNNANITTVASNSSNINTVATNIANVNTVSNNASYLPFLEESVNAIEQAVDGIKDLFTAGTHYTRDVTTQLTLSSNPAKANNVKVFFNGVWQNKDTFSRAGSVITFSEPIPSDSVEVHYEIASQFVGLNSEETAQVANALSAATTLRADLASGDEGKGTNLVSHRTGDAGSVARTLHEKLTSDFKTDLDFATIAHAINAAYASGSVVFVLNDTTVRIPTDCSTLQKAINHLSPAHGVTVTLEIQSGHTPTTGIHVENGDYSRFRVTSQLDALVTLAFPSATGFSDDSKLSSFIYADNAAAPVLACLIDANYSARWGYHLNNSASGKVEYNPSNKWGVINCSKLSAGVPDRNTECAGLRLVGACNVSAYFSRWNGCYRNMWIAHASQAFADNSNFDGATGDVGVYTARASISTFSYSTVRNCYGNAIRSRRSRVTAMSCDLSNYGGGGSVGAPSGWGVLAQEGSVVNISQDGGVEAVGANISSTNYCQGAINSESSTVVARSSNMVGYGTAVSSTAISSIDVSNSVLSQPSTGRTRAILASGGSTIVARGVYVDGCSSDSVYAISSMVDLSAGDANISIPGYGTKVAATAYITGGTRGIRSDSMSVVNATGATVTGASTYGVHALSGGSVTVQGATVTGNAKDLRIDTAGKILAFGATTTTGSPAVADTNVAAFNTWYSAGIINA